MRYDNDYYFDDFDIDNEYLSKGRSVTETDVVNFAGLSGDFAEIHINKDFGKNTVFGQNVAHGLCTMAVVSGLFVQTGILNQALAFLGIQNWQFLKPVFFGDTIYVSMSILEKKETSKKDRGVVTFHLKIINQHKEIVQEGNQIIMIKKNN
jgi:acyl dehydratase